MVRLSVLGLITACLPRLVVHHNLILLDQHDSSFLCQLLASRALARILRLQRANRVAFLNTQTLEHVICAALTEFQTAQVYHLFGLASANVRSLRVLHREVVEQAHHSRLLLVVAQFCGKLRGILRVTLVLAV